MKNCALIVCVVLTFSLLTGCSVDYDSGYKDGFDAGRDSAVDIATEEIKSEYTGRLERILDEFGDSSDVFLNRSDDRGVDEMTDYEVSVIYFSMYNDLINAIWDEYRSMID